MKLFENGVGRPSNEIKQKRRVFVVSTIALCVALVSVLAFALTKVNTNSMKGAANYLVNDVQLKFDITNAWWSGPGSKDKKFNINITKASKAYSYSTVLCMELADCKANDAYERAKKVHPLNVTSQIRIIKGLNKTTKLYNTNTKSLPGTKFYLRVTTYNSSNAWLLVDVYEINVKDGKRKCNVGYCYPVTKTRKWGKINTKYVTNTTKPNTTKPTGTTKTKVYTPTNTSLTGKVDSMWCATKTKECKEKNMNLVISKKGDYANYVSIVTCTSKNDCTRNDAWDIAAKVNKTNRLIIKKADNRTIKLTEATTKIQGRKFYVRVTSYVENDPSKWANIYVYEVSPTKYETSGKNRWLTSSKVVYSKANTSIINKPVATKPKLIEVTSIKCPGSSKVGQEFICSVNDGGLKVTVGGANSLASGYSSVFNSTDSKKEIKIKYTSDLFKNYKSIIKKDEKGKEYINASVTATRNKNSSVTTKVRIYK